MNKFIISTLAVLPLISGFAFGAVNTITEPAAKKFAETLSNFDYKKNAAPSVTGMSFGVANRLWLSKKFPVKTSNGEVYFLILPVPTGKDSNFTLATHHKLHSVKLDQTFAPIFIDGKETSVNTSYAEVIRASDTEVTLMNIHNLNVQIKIDEYTYVSFTYPLIDKWFEKDMSERPMNDFSELEGFDTILSQKDVYEKAEDTLAVLKRIKIEKQGSKL